MTDDLARQFVEADARRIGRDLATLGIADFTAVTFAELDRDGALDAIDSRTLVKLTIGLRDELTSEMAAKAATAWRRLRARRPLAMIYVCFLGYDEDPRELWQFAEVRRYIRDWAKAAGISRDPLEAKRALPDKRFPCLLGLLAGCGYFGEAVRQDVLAQFRAKHGEVSRQ
jgi:hypothetical protein